MVIGTTRIKNMKTILLLVVLLSFSCDDTEGTSSCDASSPNRTGAVCKDGTTSSSVGSGTCSSHGGVDHWICN